MIAARLDDEFSRRLAAGGLDLVKRFAAADVKPHLDGLSLETFGRPRALGIVVGNTRALWPHLLAGIDRQTAHPVDDYCARLVEAAARATGIAHQSYWSPVMVPRPLPMQRIAALAGLADLSPSHLSVHPVHGPWIALRAVVMFDAEGPPIPPSPPSICRACPRPCMAALDAALAADDQRDRTSVAHHRELWIAVRDACPVGKVSRYGAAQLAYHYSKDRKHLTER